MNLRHRDVYQHLTNTIFILSLPLFVATSLMPQQVLAFEARLPQATTAQFIAPVRLAGERLSQPALAELPRYKYTEAGSAVGITSPVTVAATWPVKSSNRLALAAVPTGSLPAPIPGHPVVLEGEASYYSRAGCLGCSSSLTMANGQPLNDNALTMAIGADRKHLVGRTAKVTSLVTGQSVQVTITDTGGFYHSKYGNRVADLTIATKQAIGMAGGTGQVRVEVF